MNILDENILEDQRQLLLRQHVRVRQIGQDLWRKGVQDEEIPRLLREFRRPTFFTRDLGFYAKRFCNRAYAVIVLSIGPREVARYVRRILHHPVLSSQSQRMGLVVLVTHRSIRVWKRDAENEEIYLWRE